jgi:hypothetical protein
LRSASFSGSAIVFLFKNALSLLAFSNADSDGTVVAKKS